MLHVFSLSKYYRLGQSIKLQLQKSWLSEATFATFVQILLHLWLLWNLHFYSISFVLSNYCQLGRNIKLEWHQQVHLGLSPQTAFVTFVTPCFGKDTCMQACTSCISLLILLFIFSLPFSPDCCTNKQNQFRDLNISSFSYTYKDANTHFVSCSFWKVICFKLMFSSLMAFESFTPQ